MGNKKKKESKQKQENKKIGVTIVSEALTSDTDNFWFAIDKDSLVAPFDFVSVKGTRGKKVIGIVDDLRVVPSKKGDYDGNQKRIANHYPTDNNEEDHILQYEKGIMVAKVTILANTDTTPDGSQHSSNLPVMPIMPRRKVRFADTEEVLFALGIPEMQNPIPAGVIKMTNGLMVPVSLDVSYIAGPDTAHVNATGISGNRKTSYLLFLLHSAYQRLLKYGVSLIIFNTKESELLQIDVEREKELSKEDAKFYSLMGLDTRSFSNVTYFLPRGSDGKPNSSTVPKNSKTYSYELQDIYDRLELLFSHTADPMYDGLISIVNYIGESWPIKGNGRIVTSWADLASFIDYPDEVVPHKSTLVHFLGYLKKFNRSNLFVEKRKRSIILEEEIKRIKAGDTYVIDLANLPTLEEQSLVVGDVMRTVDEMYSARNTAASLNRSGEAKAKYLLIFIDEINRFLPSSVTGTKRMSATAEQITRTVIAGKSRDTVLFSAQQFKSSVDDTLHDNTGTHMFAKLGFTELAKPSYQMINDSMKGNIVRLNKGDIIMTHPAFRHPIKISFPHVSFKRS
jgi:hypothetical protein